MRTICLLACMIALSAAAPESYPNKPIRIVVGYSAGGGNDVIVRAMTPEMSKGLGQRVIVENKPGAQSIIAAETVAKSPPDGYTIFMGPSGPMTVNPAIYSKLPYDPQRDFAPISMICQFPLILAVSPSLPIRNVRELIEYGKANPAEANYASSAGIFQLATELFKQKTGTDFVMIPFKGSGESVLAVMSNKVTFTIADPPPLAGQLKAGTVRGLAVTSATRHPSWPELPTMTEAGVSGMELAVWTAFFAPANTPRTIIDRLQKEVARAVRTPEVRERFAQMGVEAVASTPEELAAVVSRDLQRYIAVAQRANIKND